MIKLEDYYIEQYPNRNQIIINLPQTMQTLMNTITPIVDRKVELSDGELATILTIVKNYFEV